MKKLDKLIRRLRQHNDKLLTGWVFYGSNHNGYYLINKTFLVVAGIFNDIPKAFRIPGAVVYSNIADYINYSGYTVRVTTGSRRGVLIDISRIREDEQIIRVGLGKHLIPGRAAHRISDTREGDVTFIECLQQFAVEAHAADTLELPGIYISATTDQERSLRLRRNVNMREDNPPIKDMVPGKTLYPYSKYYGHGVVVASGWPNIKASWLPSDKLEKRILPSVNIELVEYMQEF